MGRLRRHLSFANVTSLLALFVALGGTSYAALTITSRDVKNNSLTSADIRNGTLLQKDFKRGQLRAGAPAAPGPAGPSGPQGAKGETGAKGRDGQRSTPRASTTRRRATRASSANRPRRRRRQGRRGGRGRPRAGVARGGGAIVDVDACGEGVLASYPLTLARPSRIMATAGTQALFPAHHEPALEVELIDGSGAVVASLPRVLEYHQVTTLGTGGVLMDAGAPRTVAAGSYTLRLRVLLSGGCTGFSQFYNNHLSHLAVPVPSRPAAGGAGSL
jgi:hypothetical protein